MMADNVEHVITYWLIYERFHSPALAGFAALSRRVPSGHARAGERAARELRALRPADRVALHHAVHGSREARRAAHRPGRTLARRRAAHAARGLAPAGDPRDGRARGRDESP